MLTIALRHVAATQHIGESHDFLLTTANLARFLEIAFGPDIADYTLAIELFLESAESPFGGLAFADLYF